MVTHNSKSDLPVEKKGIDVIPGPMNCHETILFKPSHEQQNAN